MDTDDRAELEQISNQLVMIISDVHFKLRNYSLEGEQLESVIEDMEALLERAHVLAGGLMSHIREDE